MRFFEKSIAVNLGILGQRLIHVRGFWEREMTGRITARLTGLYLDVPIHDAERWQSKSRKVDLYGMFSPAGLDEIRKLIVDHFWREASAVLRPDDLREGIRN